MADAKTAAPAPIDTSAGLTVLARRAMFRAGRQWPAGATDLTAAQADALGQAKLQQLAGDPGKNFTLAAIGTRAVTVTGGTPGAAPVEAHTIVHAKRTMWRAGRQWQAGVTALSADDVAKLGAAKVAALKADPNFTVTQNVAAAAKQEKAEEALSPAPVSKA